LIPSRTDPPLPTRQTLIAFLTRLLFGIYFIETGLLLIVGPWTEWWTRNLFADMLPGLRMLMAWSVTRIAVGALGLVTVVAGLSEVWRLLLRRPIPETSSQS
jgi:hypothetical protein